MIKKFMTHITPFNLERQIHLYLPDDYSQDKKYPVMYFYDGHNLFYDSDATYGKSWGLKDFLDANHFDMIIVGIECNHEGNERLNEFCPYSNQGRLGNITGKGEIFMKWVVEELKPYIDTHYSTLPQREYTGIGGSSMGGLMALYSGIAFNQYFSKCACLSSAISIVLDELKHEIAKNKLNPNTRFYMDWGSNEARDKEGLARSTSNNLTLAHLLNQKNVSTYPFLVVDGYHNEATWEKQIPIFMDYLWK